MTTSRPASLRPAALAGGLAMFLIAVLAACGDAQATPTPQPQPTSSAAAVASATPIPTPSRSPTPERTPRYTNEPDTELAELIPEEANGARVVVAAFEEFALTPGDLAVAYGEIGARFESLVLAYIEQPRATLYAMRVSGEEVRTEDLRDHLATAGRYVGIAGLDPEPWERATVGGHRVWVRPEDNATAAGTMIYTWSSGDFVFLLIGVDDSVNRALVTALPGEAAPTPRPSPSGTPAGSPSPSASGG